MLTTPDNWLDERVDRRVVVVEDDEWRRRGLADGLRQLGGALTVYAALDFDAALDFAEWSDVDIALVDTIWREDSWDHFNGLKVGAAIKAATKTSAGDAQPVAVLLTGTDVNDLLVIRAAEAGFDFVYRRDEVGCVDDLERVVLAPDLARSPGRIADFSALRRLGLSFSSRLNAGLTFLEENGLTCHVSGAQTLSRRRSITLRQRLAEMIGIRASGTASAATVERTLPSWRQVQQIVDLARGA